ncbi:sporulation protein [Pontibacillus chungwhensis BH030062]|uniref:Sporulation protein n=1 Tax=Pontibacillus chungwhensis BH030062 TaxID=1385513 RepID=A0A0A2UTL1_9BACI|nr:sporulation protein YunB [Pontibacillus chungwhensis]KGP91657.1 sporulation protein [Pontibacillus chungwhensis BH030062]
MGRNRRKGSMAPPPARQIFIITFMFFLISTFVSLWIINKGIEPKIMEIAEARTEQFAKEAIAETVSKKMAEDLNVNDLVQYTYDDQGNVVSAGFNSAAINKVTRDTLFRVNQYLTRLGEGEDPDPGISYDVDIDKSEETNTDIVQDKRTIARIPLGQATGNTLLSNLGPEIPVHFTYIGNVKADAIKEEKEYGINMLVVDIDLRVEVNLQVLLPFSTKMITVNTEVPIAHNVIIGKVPDFYNGGGGGMNPSIEVPTNPLPGP